MTGKEFWEQMDIDKEIRQLKTDIYTLHQKVELLQLQKEKEELEKQVTKTTERIEYIPSYMPCGGLHIPYQPYYQQYLFTGGINALGVINNNMNAIGIGYPDTI
jgi:hypothetical protein